MIAFICDNCNLHHQLAEGSTFPVPPNGWYDINKRGTYKSVQLCSPKCLLDYVGKEIDALPTPVASAPSPAPELTLHDGAAPVTPETLGVDTPIEVAAIVEQDPDPAPEF